MSNLILKPHSHSKQPTAAPTGSSASALPMKPPPFTRSESVDGGRFSNARHRLANFTREIFGRAHSPATPMNVAAIAVPGTPPAPVLAPPVGPMTPQQAEQSAINAFRPHRGVTFLSPANRSEQLTWV